MRYLIDTSSLSRAIRDDTLKLRNIIWTLGIDRISVSVMSIVEIEYGLRRRKVSRSSVIRNFLSHFDALSFDAQDAHEAGRLRAQMETAGRPIGMIDCMIAAQALVRDLTVVTHKARDFTPVRGLRVLEL
jgi:tRNA(fMet)-specific endonuclease VapC